MHIQATITYAEGYYIAFYKDWLQYVSKWKKWTLPTGIVFLGMALCLITFTKISLFITVSLAVIGIGELLDHFLSRYFWMRTRLSGKRINKTATIEFTDDNIKFVGPYSNGDMNWEGIESMVSTPNGFFLKPEKGISIYIPDSALDPPNSKKEILARIRMGTEQTNSP